MKLILQKQLTISSKTMRLMLQASTILQQLIVSRIIDMGMLNKYINEVVANAATCQTYQSKVESQPIDDTMLIGEEACYLMATILVYKCSGCGDNISFATLSKVNIRSSRKYWSCDLAAMWVQMATWGGFNHLEKSMGILWVPIMPKQSFIKTEQTIGKWWWDLFNDTMLAAGKKNKSWLFRRMFIKRVLQQ